MRPSPTRLGSVVGLTGCYLVSLVAGWCFHSMRLPLPWMIGPLVGTAILALCGVTTRPLPVCTRPTGQAVVATTVGLAFSAEALQAALRSLPLLLGLAAMTTVLALAVSVLQARLARTRLSRMLVATFPVAPVEAAVIASDLGLPVAPVVIAQSLRIAGIVVMIPLALHALAGGETPGPRVTDWTAGFDTPSALVLPVMGLVGAAAARWMGWANPYFLGPLSLAAAISALGLSLPPYPPLVLAGAQVLLGSWLGSTFQPAVITSARREIAISAAGTALLLLLTSLGAALLSLAAQPGWRVLVLAAAPGGVTEMALTARALHESVTLVTAAQVVRVFALMPLARPLIRWSERFDPPVAAAPP
ncbi:AbrB family transcriptional regulator [Frigidibacter sp. MR17.14]|uniref:AbrB family transcriptional regulator n=1 Tax=Frigidibacter sp. MR17.14 TaxID=3126509 RepID=UPI003013168C